MARKSTTQTDKRRSKLRKRLRLSAEGARQKQLRYQDKEADERKARRLRVSAKARKAAAAKRGKSSAAKSDAAQRRLHKKTGAKMGILSAGSRRKR